MKVGTGDVSVKKRLIKGGIWAVAVRIVGIASSFAVNALLARLLSVSEMGAYFLGLSMAGVMVLVAQFGLPQTAVRLVAESMGQEKYGQARSRIGEVLKACMMICFPVALTYYGFGGDLITRKMLHSPLLQESTGIITLMIVLMTLQGLIAEIFRGFHDVRLASIYGGVATTFFMMILFVGIKALHGHTDLRHAFDVNLLALSITLALSGGSLWKKQRDLSGEASPDSPRILAASWRICVINLAVFVATQGDLWVVGAFLPHKDAAIYGAVLRLVLILTMTQTFVVATTQSTIAELHVKGEKQKMESIVRGLTFWLCIPSGIILLSYIVWGGSVLTMIFGEYYGAGYWPLILLCGGQFIGMLFGPVEMVLIMTGMEKPLMWLIVSTGLTGIALAMVMVRRYGLEGVSLSWAIMAILQGIGAWWMVQEKVGIRCDFRWMPLSIGRLKKAI